VAPQGPNTFASEGTPSGYTGRESPLSVDRTNVRTQFRNFQEFQFLGESRVSLPPLLPHSLPPTLFPKRIKERRRRGFRGGVFGEDIFIGLALFTRA